MRTPFPENNRVWARVYLPRATKRVPTVLVLPILAARNTWVEERFCRLFARAGLAAVLLELPYQFHRRPDPWGLGEGRVGVHSGAVFLSRDPEVLARNFRQAVSDAVQAAERLQALDFVQKDALGVLGISLGAMVGAAAFKKTPALRAGVFLLGGADFPRWVYESKMTAFHAARSGWTQAQLRRIWEDVDPLYLKDVEGVRSVLLVNARWDRIVPAKNARALKKAFPFSRQVWVPFGHYSSAVHLIWLPDYVLRYFERHLKP
ncbi:MAG: prolyl oligopeptidase family serine peptidase [Elusimicrobia bacterium]|nr:prolyl oligopeptidase family serine peptidase [Elusimicrobiota bacterium]